MVSAGVSPSSPDRAPVTAPGAPDDPGATDGAGAQGAPGAADGAGAAGGPGVPPAAGAQPKPVILTVDDDPGVSRAVARDLRR